MTENTESMNETNTPENQEVPENIPVDPVIGFLASLRFEQDVFAQLQAVSEDPEQYDKYFRIPELFIFLNAHYVLNDNDPNRGNVDHQAIQNLIKWMTLKTASDPVWMCYFGWFFRFFAAHTDPTSYWPIKFTPRFLPKNFIKRGEKIDIVEENAKVKTPEEVFKRPSSSMNPGKMSFVVPEEKFKKPQSTTPVKNPTKPRRKKSNNNL